MPTSRGEAMSDHSWSDHEPCSREDRTREARNYKTSRVRSRSPTRRHQLDAGKERRSASPHGDSRSSHGHNHDHHHNHHHRRRGHHKSRHAPDVSSGPLPFSARLLTRSDYSSFEPLFAHYLDLQKQKYLDEMDEREARGRWKSFMGKWNRNELAEGWYDPEMFAKCTAEYSRAAEGSRWEEEKSQQPPESKPEPLRRAESPRRNAASHSRNSDEDDEYGPALPSSDPRLQARVGAKIPTRHDLSLRNELHAEQREAEREELRHARRADRALQKERLEELVPRAEPGTRERKLEKKQEVNEKMRQFRDKSPGMEAADDREAMGGGDELEEYKKEKEREQKRKSERQARREEFERAKQEEMEERRRAWQEREDGTVSMLRELAKQRFG